MKPGVTLVHLDPACGAEWAVLMVGGVGASRCFRDEKALYAAAKGTPPSSPLALAAHIVQNRHQGSLL